MSDRPATAIATNPLQRLCEDIQAAYGAAAGEVLEPRHAITVAWRSDGVVVTSQLTRHLRFPKRALKDLLALPKGVGSDTAWKCLLAHLS